MSTPSTLRAALYARYSTDKQRETSIDDQLRAARARAEAQGWAIVATHVDEGISGSVPVALRRGGKALLADVLAGRWDVLIVEGLDRLSRELGEAEQLVKRIEHRGLRIIGTADGYDTEARGRKVMRIARGLVNELYLDDLREKTHRGLAGQFDRGLSAGGRSYGYRSEAVDGGRRMVIDEAEATVVRQVFEWFADGHSTRSIAHRLNEQGTPSARGGTWAVSALQGSSGKGLGMLNNELYIGRVIWNRRQWLKDPDTGARRYVDRPAAEWQVREAPELRIVSEDLWRRVQDRARNGPPRGTRVGKGAIPRTLFGGLLRCAVCEGPMVAINALRYGCNANKDRGETACSNRTTVLRAQVDRRLMAVLRDDMLAPNVLADLQADVRQILASSQREAHAGQAEHRRRLHTLQGEINRLVDAVATVGISAALQARLQAAETERAQIEATLASIDAPAKVVNVIDDVTGRFKALLMQLQGILEDEADRDRTRRLLADMMGPVTIEKEEGTGEVYARFEDPAERLLSAAVGGSMGLVAGAGFEPTTFGL
jgi:site-specific DNA recombinase